MSDAASELAALVADTLAAVESWRSTGASVLAAGPLAGLPAGEPWPEAAAAPQVRGSAPGGLPAAVPARPAALAGPVAPPAGRPAPAPRPAPIDPRPVVAASPPLAPAPRLAASPPLAPSAPTPSARPATPARPAEPPPAPRPEAPAGGGMAGLFGSKWQAALRDRGEELRDVLAALPACPDCGVRAESLAGSGKPEAPLVVLAAGDEGATLAGEAGAMLDCMLLNVLAVERGDVWLLEANACAAAGGGCRIALRRQVDVVRPRLVLAMGAATGVVLGGGPAARGEWAPFGSADVLTTFHPVELVRRPADKRPAMEHLTTLRRRM